MPDNAPNQIIATGTLKIVPDTDSLDQLKADLDQWLSGIERRMQALFTQAQAVTAGRPAAMPDPDNKPVPATPDKLRDEPPLPPSRIPEAFPDRPPVVDPQPQQVQDRPPPPEPQNQQPPPPPPPPTVPAEQTSGQDQVVQQLIALNSKLDILGGEVVLIRSTMQERE